MRCFSLIYHDVVLGQEYDYSGFPGASANAYKLPEPEFAAHLERLSRMVETKPALAAEVLREPATSTLDYWMLHFDDGGRSSLEMVGPLLERKGWKAHFHVPTDFIGRPAFLSPWEIQQLHQRGHVIGSHSCSHPRRISSLKEDALLKEWKKSREVLSNIVGEEVTVGSVPGGFYSLRVARAAAKAGLKVLFNSEPICQPQWVDGCLILGRYSIMAATPAKTAADIAMGKPMPRLSQFVAWNCKKVAKTVGDPVYSRVRASLLRRRARTT